MSQRNEAFARLLKGAINSIAAYEGKTSPSIENDLGEQIGISGATIQRWKAGTLPHDERAVEILAEAAVQRGYLGREWLQRFLHAARYPFADKLLDRLSPIGLVRPRPPRVYHNLPAPTYSQFVMREEAFAEVQQGLSKQSAITLIVGLGGNGKTSLAREVAARCLGNDNDTPQFDAVVWVSDKDRPGTTNLSIVLDEIAHALDYPGFTQFEHDEKRREVENLLRRQRVLIVVDNFETMTDGVLLSWLQNLSEPSKALITAREYRREFRRGGWLVELRGMTDTEARELVSERLRVLKIEKLVSDHTQLEPLLVATGGNPKAIEITLGLMKYEHLSLQQVVDDLYAARGELFEDLFTRAWSLLDEVARRVLVVMTFFPASASGAALAATADVQGFAFDRVLERLTDLALLDVQQADLLSLPRYTLHSLVRAFAGAKLREQPAYEQAARERWVEWYLHFVSNVGYCWEDYSKLNLLNPEQDTICSVITWTAQTQQDTATIQLAKGISYYFYVRGLWDRQQEVERMHFAAAHRLGRQDEVAMAVAFLCQAMSRQGHVAEAEKYLDQLADMEDEQQLSIEAFFEFQHALALYWMTRRDLDQVEKARQRGLEVAHQLPWIMLNNSYHRLADCLYQKGKIPEASKLFQKALEDSIRIGNPRATAFHQVKLAKIDLDQGRLEAAASRLQQSSTTAYQLQDRSLTVETKCVYARLYTLRGDLPAARAALAEAVDLFERLGMRREFAETRAALANLEVREDIEIAG